MSIESMIKRAEKLLTGVTNDESNQVGSVIIFDPETGYILSGDVSRAVVYLPRKLDLNASYPLKEWSSDEIQELHSQLLLLKELEQ
jgi:hypothetical protein